MVGHGEGSSGPPERRPAPRVLENVEYTTCKCRSVAVAHDITLQPVENELGYSANAGRNDRSSGGHGLE